jgi:DNA polymerase I
VSSKDYLILIADYSQVELRILANLSQDRILLEAFKNGEDIHNKTAKFLF